MSQSSQPTCLNCERTEADVPISAWRYQGRDMYVCSECLPVLIHERAKLAAKWQAQQSAGEGNSGDDHTQRDGHQ